MKQRAFIVKVIIPEECDEDRMAKYICCAVGGWSGQYHPDDPLFGWFDEDTLNVRAWGSTDGGYSP